MHRSLRNQDGDRARCIRTLRPPSRTGMAGTDRWHCTKRTGTDLSLLLFPGRVQQSLPLPLLLLLHVLAVVVVVAVVGCDVRHHVHHGFCAGAVSRDRLWRSVTGMHHTLTHTPSHAHACGASCCGRDRNLTPDPLLLLQHLAAGSSARMRFSSDHQMRTIP